MNRWIDHGLTFGVSLREVYESTAVWSCGLNIIARHDGDGSHVFTLRGVLLQSNEK